MRNHKLYPPTLRRPFVCRDLILTLALAVGATGAAWAASVAPALVAAEAVQWPVWVEREGLRRPLVPGDTLKAQDKLATGDGGKAMLRLADGSAVKLGANAQFEIKGLRSGQGGALDAALDVVKGAFRFTTGLFKARLHQRTISVQVATITAGVRGTDLWGKSDAERDLVCLLEGQISVTHARGGMETMDRPLTFYTAARDQAPGPVTTVDAAQVAQWAAETEVDGGAGVGRVDGKWQLGLGSVNSETAALAMIDRASELGVPVRALPQREGDGFRYELRVRNLASKAEAGVLAARLGPSLQLKEVSVFR